MFKSKKKNCAHSKKIQLGCLNTLNVLKMGTYFCFIFFISDDSLTCLPFQLVELLTTPCIMKDTRIKSWRQRQTPITYILSLMQNLIKYENYHWKYLRFSHQSTNKKVRSDYTLSSHKKQGVKCAIAPSSNRHRPQNVVDTKLLIMFYLFMYVGILLNICACAASIPYCIVIRSLSTCILLCIYLYSNLA